MHNKIGFQKTAEEIANNEIHSYLRCEIMTWLPVVEGNFGQQRYLIEDPNESFREGRFEKANVIVGVTADEFISPAASKKRKIFNYYWIMIKFLFRHSQQPIFGEVFQRKF